MRPDPAPEPRITGPGFHARVHAVVERIPRGRVSTYGDIARALGSVRVARHVGWCLAAPGDPELPWFRVVKSDGRLAFPLADPRGVRQRGELAAEGVGVTSSGRIDGFRSLRVSLELLVAR